MLYQIRNGVVEYSGEAILEEIQFEIRDREKIAIVGRNGSGKTTLLKLIAGELEIVKRDSDEDMFIAKAGNPVIGYQKQLTFSDEEITMEEEVRKVFENIENMKDRMEELRIKMEEDHSEKIIKQYTDLQEHFTYLGGYYYEKEYEVVIKNFGFAQEDKKKKLTEFSGGQRTKIAFMKLLLSHPDILLLDEPTNHLDIETVIWLEGYLKTYDRAVVIVSHDRLFLDHIVDVVYEIEHQTTSRYVGNYSHFLEEKKQNWEKMAKDYASQQKEIARLTAIIDKFKNKPSKVAMTRSKLKVIEHMDKIDPPARYDLKSFHSNFKPDRESVRDVLNVKNLEIGYDKVLSTVNLAMKRGDKIGIIGGNGIGKSTFLKTIVGQIKALNGTYSIGGQTDIGYFDQKMAQYSSSKTVMDDFWDEFPMLNQFDVRSALGAFLFTQEEVFKTVDMLSGGEKVRLALCKLFKRKPNFLILDEPTNHMDIVGKETLEAMLKGYTGSLIFVSHDRYFIREVADKLLVFDGNEVQFYPYGYEEYLEKTRSEENAMQAEGKKEKEITENQDRAVLEEQKIMQNPGKEKAKLERQRTKAEEQILQAEEELEVLKAELADPKNAVNYNELTKIQDRIDEKEQEILEHMENWEECEKKLQIFLEKF